MTPKYVASSGTLTLAVSTALAWSVLPAGAAKAIPFDKADIFYELNATDGDVGVHVSLDAESWRVLKIANPRGTEILEVEPESALRRIGLTELFLEGEEPSLEEVPFSRFRELFPDGQYVFTGTTTSGQPLRSTDPLTAELPCPVKVLSPPEEDPVASDEILIRWQPAPGLYNPDTQHCNVARDVGLVGYQVIVVIENEDHDILREFQIDLPLSARQVSVTPGLLRGAQNLPGTEFTLEVLAIEDSGNKTITEQSFEVE